MNTMLIQFNFLFFIACMFYNSAVLSVGGPALAFIDLVIYSAGEGPCYSSWVTWLLGTCFSEKTALSLSLCCELLQG